MDELNKRHSLYFIFFAIAMLTVLVSTLTLWAQTQDNCWSRYDTEQQAIQECEQ